MTGPGRVAHVQEGGREARTRPGQRPAQPVLGRWNEAACALQTVECHPSEGRGLAPAAGSATSQAAGRDEVDDPRASFSAWSLQRSSDPGDEIDPSIKTHGADKARREGHQSVITCIPVIVMMMVMVMASNTSNPHIPGRHC